MDTATTAPADGLTHRRAVVLHADVVDYSRLLADDPAATVATVRAYQDLVAAAIGDADGTLVNFVGDSFLAAFDDAAAAMRAAMRICAEVRARNADLPRTRRAWFRLGLDAGEIVVTADGRHFGDPLNIAARIQAIAEAGGINVTEAIYTELDEPALRLIDTGSRRLKNIPEPVRVYRLAGVGRRDDAGAPPPVPATPAVAVLLLHHADDPVDRQVAAALHLELVDALGALAGLRVVDRRDVDGEVERSRGAVSVGYALHGGVVRSGTRLRVYVSLGEMETMNQVWTGRWEGSTDDLFAVQDAMASAVVRAMEVELVVGEPAMIYRSELDAEARELVYRGWHHFHSGTAAGWRRARDLFARVRDAWPAAVTGYALAAFAGWWGAVEGLSATPAEDLEAAAADAARGAELGDPTGLSELVTAALHLQAGQDLAPALAAARASLALRPTCDVSFGVLGSVQRYLGEWEAAVASCQRAADLSPVGVPWFATVQASAYYVGERYHDAARLAEQVVDVQPGNREALQVLAASQQALGLHRRARAAVGLLRERHAGTTVADLPRRHPFRDPAIIARWTEQLTAAGLP